MDLLVPPYIASLAFLATLVNLFLLPSANLLTYFQASRDFLLQVSCIFCSAPLFRGIFLACGHQLLIPFAGFNGFIGAAVYRIPALFPDFGKFIFLPSANLLTCFQASGDLFLQVSCVLLLCSSIQRNFLAAEHHLLVLLLSFNRFIGFTK